MRVREKAHRTTVRVFCRVSECSVMMAGLSVYRMPATPSELNVVRAVCVKALLSRVSGLTCEALHLLERDSGQVIFVPYANSSSGVSGRARRGGEGQPCLRTKWRNCDESLIQIANVKNTIAWEGTSALKSTLLSTSSKRVKVF
jgi:hypothetical protein